MVYLSSMDQIGLNSRMGFFLMKPGDMPPSFQRRPFYHSSGDDHNEHIEEGNDDETDVREVWFAGCHSGKLCVFASRAS